MNKKNISKKNKTNKMKKTKKEDSMLFKNLISNLDSETNIPEDLAIEKAIVKKSTATYFGGTLEYTFEIHQTSYNKLKRFNII